MRVENRRAAIRTLETLGQRLQQPRQHERERLESLDGPLEVERRVKRIVGHPRDQRDEILAACRSWEGGWVNLILGPLAGRTDIFS